MNAPGWPEKGWHYRRSLASRVILLTTIAVGFAVALVALAVFLTVRMQMQSSLDQSLLDRARQAASGGAVAGRGRRSASRRGPPVRPTSASSS